MNKATTRGGVILEDIKIGDILYEYEYGFFIKSEVVTTPVNDNGYWSWSSKNTLTGREIEYAMSQEYKHYGPKLYNHEAYRNCEQI